MTTYNIDCSRRECIYCHKMIEPILYRDRTEIRLICPRCELTIEVMKIRSEFK